MKYKININDNINSTSKDITNLEKDNKTTKISNARYTINVKKNKKKRILLFSLYLLAFSSTTITTVVFLNSNVTFNNSEFNPNANNRLWADYYHNHHRDSTTPISLKSTIEYFHNSKNIIVYNVTKEPKDKEYIDFTSILTSIDSGLQNAKVESDIDNDNPNLLPINFFLNVNYNPAVNFTIIDDNKFLPITANTFTIPKNFNNTINYVLNVATNSQASIFGLKDTIANFQINITIKNQIAIDIANLQFDFPKQTLSISDPKNATIDSIKEQWLMSSITEQVATTLSNALNVRKEEIIPSYYKIDFVDGSKSQDFTKPVTVQFTITTNNAEENPWRFNGTKKCTINVQNEIADLSKMTQLTTEIEKQYNNDKDNKNFQITLDNEENNNADSSLSDSDLTFVNNKIIAGVQTICQSYFQKNYANLNITPNDYLISTDLVKGANIFNNKLGKNIKITITRNDKSSKLQNTLSNINAIVHGHNKNNITNNIPEQKFKLDGIWLKDGKDGDILQEGQHFYEQNSLLNNWINNKDSVLNTVNNNSYQPIADIFSGSFTMNYILDTKNTGNVTVDITTINEKTTNGKVANFWDLITKTKAIFLETDVTTTSGWALNNVKLIFTTISEQPTPENTLYTLDLSSKFNEIAVSNRAHLTFPDFNFNFKYKAES